jgi:hypothetical protein
VLASCVWERVHVTSSIAFHSSNFLFSLFALTQLFVALIKGHSGPKMLNANHLSLFSVRFRVRR